MDGGPFRVPQPAERRSVSRSEHVRRQSEKQPVDEPRPAPHYSGAPRSEKRKFPRWTAILLSIIVVAVVAAAGWFAWSNMRATGALIDSDKYQAVFFTNGQVYFGKLTTLNGDYMKLTDIYYLQTQASDDVENPQKGTTEGSNVQLIKLGGEIHGPEDEMIISKDQVLFYENLKSDGKVSQSIAENNR